MTARSEAKGIWGWMLFDWASQPFHTVLLTFVFGPYFATRVAADPVAGQAAWGWMLGAAGIGIAFLAPVMGALADSYGARKPWIAAFSVVYIVGATGLWVAAPGLEDVTMVLIFFALALIGAEFATVFTNAMLPEITTRDDVGRVSGSGWAMGYWGGLASLVIVLGLMVGNVESGRTLFGLVPILGLDPVVGAGERAAGPFSALWYVVFVLPLFIWTRDLPFRKVGAGVGPALKELGATIRGLGARRSFASYLGSSMLYRDALNGLYAFGGIYAGGVLGWTIIQIGIFGLFTVVTGAIGAWFGGRCDRRFGPKPVITLCIVALTIVCIVVVLTTPTSVLGMPITEGSGLPTLVFYICGSVIGACGGALQAASRTLLVRQSPADQMGQSFGLYALAGKATAFIAPLSIAWVTMETGSQQIGVTPLVFLFLAGLVVLYWVDPDGEPDASQ
ncbi:MAG: MFS transporter [Pseudomonadota bacterium]